MKVPHYIIVEPQEIDLYKKAIKHWDLNTTVLELDLSFKDKYELCDKLGLEKSTGPGPARNFAWEHSKANGFAWHWVMDDNIRYFHRFNKNLQVKVTDGTCFKVMEDFVQRYVNVGMAGPNYMMFAPRKSKLPPFVLNSFCITSFSSSTDFIKTSWFCTSLARGLISRFHTYVKKPTTLPIEPIIIAAISTWNISNWNTVNAFLLLF